jgi:hypothetical protein
VAREHHDDLPGRWFDGLSDDEQGVLLAEFAAEQWDGTRNRIGWTDWLKQQQRRTAGTDRSDDRSGQSLDQLRGGWRAGVGWRWLASDEEMATDAPHDGWGLHDAGGRGSDHTGDNLSNDPVVGVADRGGSGRVARTAGSDSKHEGAEAMDLELNIIDFLLGGILVLGAFLAGSVWRGRVSRAIEQKIADELDND